MQRCPSYSPDFVDYERQQKQALAALNAAYERHFRLEIACAVMMEEISIDDKCPVNQCKTLCQVAKVELETALAVATDAIPNLKKRKQREPYHVSYDDDSDKNYNNGGCYCDLT